MEREGHMPEPGSGEIINQPTNKDSSVEQLNDILSRMSPEQRASMVANYMGRGAEQKEDPIESELPEYRKYDKSKDFASEAEKTETQIRWLEGLMTKFETGSAMDLNSYLSSQAQQNQRGLIDKITHLNKGAYYYFQTRMSANKALNAPSEIGGSVDGFLQYGQMLGDTELQDTLTQRPQVARAYAKLEARANVHAYGANGKFIKSENPAFADVDQLDKIEASIGNDIAQEFVDQQIRDGIIPATDRGKCLIQEKEIQLRNVKQAEILWRIWKRSARQNGLVFKPLAEANTALRRDGQKAINVKDEEGRERLMTEGEYTKLREYLLYLPYLERIKHWEIIVALADWGTSLSGSVNEDAIQRLTWGGIYHQKNAQGIEAIRPGIDYDSKDFFSYLVTSSGYLTNSDNFRLEPWHKKVIKALEEKYEVEIARGGISEEEKSKLKADLEKDKQKAVVFTKYDPKDVKDKTEDQLRTIREKTTDMLINEKGEAEPVERIVYERTIGECVSEDGTIISGRTERLIVHPNGVVEIDSNSSFDLSKLKLFMAGGKDYYTGKFTAYYLRYADEMRKNVMNPEKIGRDPFAKPLESLIGLAEHLDSIDKETEKFLLKIRNEEKRDPTKDEIDIWLDKKRTEGKIFKEDAFRSLSFGMMKFQTTELKEQYLGENINLEQVDTTINYFVGRHMLTKDQGEDLKKEMSILMGYPENDFINHFVYNLSMFYYRDKPQEALLVIFLAILKQGFSDIK